MTAFALPVTLIGQHVHLVPLDPGHHDDLVQAVRDGELWNLWYTAIPTPEGMANEIARRLDLQAKGSMCPFTVIDPASGRWIRASRRATAGCRRPAARADSLRRPESAAAGRRWYRCSGSAGRRPARCPGCGRAAGRAPRAGTGRARAARIRSVAQGLSQSLSQHLWHRARGGSRGRRGPARGRVCPGAWRVRPGPRDQGTGGR